MVVLKTVRYKKDAGISIVTSIYSINKKPINVF